MIRRALISVSDKTGLAGFARGLHEAGVDIISTGGTARALADAGIPATSMESVTGFPEMLDGRVKTLHPVIHAGLLAVRDNPMHMETLERHGIGCIDLVVVNLYPFEATVARGASLEECIEQIDIGGPSMLRSAAKNHAAVTVVCDPADYETVLGELRAHGDTTPETRFVLASKVFARTAAYDAAIAAHLAFRNAAGAPALPPVLSVTLPRSAELRYGENPHQQAALYGTFFDVFQKLHGKELSFNNIVDLQAAAALVEEFSEPVAAIIKHTNPCGCATGRTLSDAWRDALATDPASAYGGVVALNRTVDAAFAKELNALFTEVVIAPSFDDDALELLRKKRDRRLILQRGSCRPRGLDIKMVANGALCQTRDIDSGTDAAWTVVTKRAPTGRERAACAFAWRIVTHVKSNAIVYTDERRTLGIGAGQMSRVDSSAIAVLKARNANLSLEGSVVASDAFFPFADGLLEAVSAGATAAVQPGGSVRDADVIAAADEHNIAMLFTGIRHFKH